MAVKTLIQIRRGTSAEWAASNGNLGSVLEAGELGLDTTLDRIKIGDGSTAWNSLEFVAMSFTDILTGSGVAITQLTDSNSQVTGLSFSTNLVPGDNITLVNNDGAITIHGEAGITLSEGTGIHIVVDGADHNINVSGLTSSLITDFNSAVDARVTAASISEEQVLDIVSTGLYGGTGIHVVYDDDGSGQIQVNISGLTISNITDITASASEINVLDNVTPGTVSAGDAVVVDGNKDIGDFRNVTAETFIGNVVGNVTGNLSGVAYTATNIEVTANNTTNETVYLTFVDGATSTQGIETDTDLTYNPSTNTLTATNFAGNANSASQVSTQSIGSDADYYLTFVDSNNGSPSAESIYTDIEIKYNPSSNKLSVGSINTSSDVNVGGQLIVAGNLTVSGTTTTVNSTTVDIGDNIIQVNVSGSETLGGFQILDHDNNKTHQLVWDTIDSRWEFINTEGLSPDVYTSGSITATNFIGNGSQLTDLDFSNITSNIPDPIITGLLTGAVTGIASVTLTDLDDGLLSIATTIIDGAVDTAQLADGAVTSDKIENGTILDIDISNSANINIAKLSASGITLGNTAYYLGDTTTALSGMTSFAGTSAANPVRLYWAVIDGGSP